MPDQSLAPILAKQAALRAIALKATSEVMISKPQNNVVFDGNGQASASLTILYVMTSGSSITDCVLTGPYVSLNMNKTGGDVRNLTVTSGAHVIYAQKPDGTMRYSDGLTISSGGVVECSSNTTISNVDLGGSGSRLFVYKGSSINGATIHDHAYGQFARLEHGILRSGAWIYIQGDNAASRDIDVYDATMVVQPNGFVDGLTAHDGATVGVDGKSANVRVEGGVVTITAGGSINGFTVLSGGRLKMSGTSLGIGQVDVGGTLEIFGNARFDAPITLQIGALLQVDGIKADGARLRYDNGVLTLVKSDGSIAWSIRLNGDYDATGFQLRAQGNDIVISYDPGAPCFCPGARIMMADGSEKNVEFIVPGDEIAVYKNGIWAQDTVVWVGQRRVQAKLDRPLDLSGLAIRISKDAFSKGCPRTDLFVSAEHCVYHDGFFVPARMLVNGGSIAYDETLLQPTYHHIETATHAIVSANGLLSETFLDSGNRHAFHANDHAPLAGLSTKTWCRDAAAPLVTDRAAVEPLHRELEIRSIQMGFAPFKPRVDLTSEIKIICQNGETAVRQTVKGQKYIFDLPKDAQTLKICSDVFRPCDTVGPFVDDRRQLGLLVGRIALVNFEKGVSRLHDISEHLTCVTLPGWHDLTPHASVRWTEGVAVLPLPEYPRHEETKLMLEILDGPMMHVVPSAYQLFA